MSAALTSTEPGDRDLALALSRHTHSVLQSNWMVGEVLSITPAAEIVVVLQNPMGTTTAPVYPNVLASDAANYVGARIEFTSGLLGGIVPLSGGETSPYGRISSTIKSVTTNTGPPPSTIMVLSDALPAEPNPGDRFVIYRAAGTQGVSGSVTANQGTAGATPWPVSAAQSGTWTATANQGTAGTTPWPVTDQPVKIAGNVADGTNVTANQPLFSPYYAVTSQGAIVLTISVDASGSAAELEVTWDGGGKWWVCLVGQQLQPGQVYSLCFPVDSGDSWAVSFAGATVLGRVRAQFAPSI